jgi:hypothetical protein
LMNRAARKKQIQLSDEMDNHSIVGKWMMFHVA